MTEDLLAPLAARLESRDRLRPLYAAAVALALLIGCEASAKADTAGDAVGTGDPAKGRILVMQTCGACHGIDGRGTTEIIPKLAGQFPEYIVKQLNAFKPANGQKAHRENAIMSPIAANLSDIEIANVAAYFSAQEPATEPAAQAALVETGKQLYTKGNPETGLPACISCHRPNGSGIRPDFPRLAGQKPAYIEQQLTDWAATRGGPGKLMTLIVPFLRPDDIPALSAYIAQLK